MSNFASQTSAQGLNLVLDPRRGKCERILWSLILIASMCGFFYYVRESYKKWLYQPDISAREGMSITDYSHTILKG